jgi:hypothetical protein
VLAAFVLFFAFGLRYVSTSAPEKKIPGFFQRVGYFFKKIFGAE